jgi:hypothetical protein
MKPQGRLGGFRNCGLEFRVELLGQARGNVLILPGGFQNILLHQRMVLYFHRDRARSTPVQNSSSDNGATRPESSSSRRRAASSRPPSASASSPKTGAGSESRSQTIKSARSRSGSADTALLMSATDITQNYSAMSWIASMGRALSASAERVFITHFQGTPLAYCLPSASARGAAI